MCYKYDIVLNNAHRALADVVATFELLVSFMKKSPIDDYISTIGYLSKYGEPEFHPAYAKIFATENRYEKLFKMVRLDYRVYLVMLR
ncbi:hypothetical protein KHA80_06475 [Anaerobacillus sp. HL2]|nr:hypothetical protein KHA80_06475 [Anaerobacillus sp. HL2]